MKNGINSFSDLLNCGEYEFEKTIEVAKHADENIANNRLFVWHFESEDLEEFLEIFKRFQSKTTSEDSRLRLDHDLMNKVKNMIREGYNPIECMLYASKQINSKINNDREVQTILAEKVRDIYIMQEEDSISVLDNILKMWSWVPQLQVVVMAIGLIGDNEELLDKILFQYGNDEVLRMKVFHAFLQNKTSQNLERIMKLIIHLNNTEEDRRMGRILKGQIDGFGSEGIKIVTRYKDNPGVSREGKRVIDRILLNVDVDNSQSDEDFVRRKRAKASSNDKEIFKEFLADCEERRDNTAYYLCRFSSPEIGEFLIKELENHNYTTERDRDTIVVSLGYAASKGYTAANKVFQHLERENEAQYSVLMARIINGDVRSAVELAEMFTQKREYELGDLYKCISMANIATWNRSKEILQNAFYNVFCEQKNNRDDRCLENYLGNLEMFWDKKMYSLLNRQLIIQIEDLLGEYTVMEQPYSDYIVMSAIEIIEKSWNAKVESLFFNMEKNAPSKKIQEVCFKKLKTRKIDAPR